MKMMANPRREPITGLALAAATLVLGETVVALFGHPLIGAAFAAPALAVLGAAVWIAKGRENEGVFTERLQRQVEQGRRLAIYDHDTGLFAEWYLAMRLDEECSRASRYSAPLSVILVAVEPSADRMADEARVLDAIRVKLRAVDFAGCLATARYLLVLPHTDTAGANVLLGRLRELATFDAAVAEFPVDGGSATELYAATEGRLAPATTTAPGPKTRLRRAA
jgi:hypothetical protein